LAEWVLETATEGAANKFDATLAVLTEEVTAVAELPELPALVEVVGAAEEAVAAVVEETAEGALWVVAG
jgi:hypothetical protein